MQTTRNFWPIGIILAFLVFIGGTAGLIVLAATQKTELVSKDYYEQELKYQNRIDSLGHAKGLSTNASAAYDPNGRRIVISLPAEHVKEKAAGQIQCYRPSAAGLDRRFKLDLDANGIQSIDAAGLIPGLWKVRVSWNVGGRDFFLDQKIVIGSGHEGLP